MSCNDVCMYVDDDASSEFSREAIRRAAKPHQCFECGGAIAVGDRYEYFSGKCDGDFFTQKTCLACVEIATAFYCGGRMLGTLWEDVRDQIFPEWNEVTAIDCLARLKTDAAVAKMRAAYAKYSAPRRPAEAPLKVPTEGNQ
jgi:hypothetical protein